jgi:hypothetical protein
MPSRTPKVFPDAVSPAPDVDEAPQTERLESDRLGLSSSGKHHNKPPDAGYGGTRDDNSGKQSNIANFRNLALSLSRLQSGFESKLGTFH